MERPSPSSQEAPSSPAADRHNRHRSLSIAISTPQNQRPAPEAINMRRLSISGSLGNSCDKGASTTPHQRRSAVSKNVDATNTWPIAKDYCKGNIKHSDPVYTVLPNSGPRALRAQDSKGLVSRLSLDRRLLPYAESRRTECHLTTRGTPIANFTEKLERLAAEQAARPRLYSSGPQIATKSGQRRFLTDEGEALLVIDRRVSFQEELNVKLEDQFERLLSAIDGVSKQLQTAFEGLHERVDCLQASLAEEYNSGWKKMKDRLDQVGTPDSGLRKRGARLARSADGLSSLEEATEVAREDIRLLTGMLIVEKDADLMLARDFQDRQAMLLKMMQPYLSKPAFQNLWDMKHGLDHCVASVLFRTSNILARTQSVMGTGSGSKFATEDSDETHFKRFCRKGQKSLEAMADWEEEKWSAQLKKEFLNACKGVWHLQSMVVALMMAHQVEILRPEAGSKYDEATMDTLDSLSGEHFQPIVEFTVFPGFKIEGSVIIKSQVYLQPKYAAVSTGC
ncbi:hypothetical protein GOP47_0019057 [Adiantum capillus-veneris]|uniref:Uncharacterized protein n=1 Tax=Adiantum capillus-veneris TaxID=13818 RepID=A0A9D4UEC9_ADICA|nr:hypothetical protein GOP47_0019057 [Adiantum capillus-veneris]